MVRPAQKLTTVPVSCVEIGDKISYDAPHDKGVFVTKVGTVHKLEVHGHSRYLLTQEGGRIMAWQHGEPEPRVFIVQHAPQPQSILELFG